MSLDRAWSRRPLVSAPAFGLSIPDVWKESTVEFKRATMVKSHGGLTGGPLTVFLACRAHVEEADEPAGPYNVGGAIVQRRLLRVFMDYPTLGDPEVSWTHSYGLPQKGDTVVWESSVGVRHEVSIRVVADPLNAHDHLEIESELFE